MAEKKKFFDIETPIYLKSDIKLIAYDISSLNGRTIKIDLTRILRGKSVEAIMKVKVNDNKAQAELLKLTVMPFFIRRMMRKSISYVEDSFLAESKDCKLRIKPFMITRKKVSRAVRKALRENGKQYLLDYVKDKNCDEIFTDTISSKLQKLLSSKMKKIYPLAFCEIREIKKLG